MDNNNRKKYEQLGMPYGTACNRLRKVVLFSLLKRLNENLCFQCGNSITSAESLSLEHKIPWLDESSELFWDLENIAFSHLSCNSANSRKHPGPRGPHGRTRYERHGCRCEVCRIAKVAHNAQRYAG